MGKKSKRAEAAADSNDDDDVVLEKERAELSSLVTAQNKKKKKSGGFQSMGLASEVFRGVIKKGYKVPTPIQRKAIPVILDGRDVVAMARTGSGKTAAFLVPLFNRLLRSSSIGKSSGGARALILSPTRELALQTLKFSRDLGRYTGLRSVCVLGGESMEKQFAMMHERPDIVIATPGRFVHLCVEMGLKLDAVEYVVFDEADRLFEMGFGEQLREILGRLPDARQTLLFSATLPKLLVEFAKAGLSDPTLIRLDVDTKIPETLKMAFFHCREEGKTAALLHLLKTVIPTEQQTVVFCATRHHVEYLHLLLDEAGISNTFIYSVLDPTARKINAAKFQAKKCRVLIVTDLAARGIDIPLLDNVINFNFPCKSKLFVHRVGRVARAGRAGTSYSLVAGDEVAYFIDLQLFLGNSIKLSPVHCPADADWHNVLGALGQQIYDDYADLLHSWHERAQDLSNMKQVAANGYKQYLKSRTGASVESVKRARKMKAETIGTHPLLVRETTEVEQERTNFLEQMKNFRPANTIFETGNTANSTKIRSVMCGKRSVHETAISRYHKRKENENVAIDDEEENDSGVDEADEPAAKAAKLEDSTQADLKSTFSGRIVQPKAVREARVFDSKKGKKRKIPLGRDEDNFIGYEAKDFHTEAGYSLMNNFEAQAKGAVLDLTGDDDASARAKKNQMRWDAKKKKYVRADASDKKKIKTESGVWIPASYKSNRYNKWKERSKLAQMQEDEDAAGGDENEDGPKKQMKGKFRGLPSKHPAMVKANSAVPKHKKSELKRPEQILKARKLQDKQRMKNARKKRKGRKR